MHDIKHAKKYSLKLLKLLFVNLIVLIILVEVVFYSYFRSPIRFFYPFSTSHIDIQTDFNATYISDFRTGHRLVECQNNKKNKEVLFVGDSFTWGIGLEMRDTFVSLYSCQRKNYLVRNLGTAGIGIELYKQILKNYNLKNTKTIYLVFFENDWLSVTEPGFKKLKQLISYNSFSFYLLKKLKNIIKPTHNEECLKINGLCNVLYTTFVKYPNQFKKRFEVNILLRDIFDKELYQIIENINQKSQANIIALVIPDPSVVSKNHVDFYTKLGSTYLPKFRELSPLAKRIKLLSHELNFKYLPFYEHIISFYEENDNPNLYLKHDTHFNRNGSYELFRYIVNYEELN